MPGVVKSAKRFRMYSSPLKTLIIKLGATGDVVRTTPLLHTIDGEIHWLTSSCNVDILPNNCTALTRVFSIENDLSLLTQQYYQHVFSLDESPAVLAVLNVLDFESLSGVYRTENGLVYTDTASEWFNMSLISALGRERADRLKLTNRKSYQELLFGIAAQQFKGERYWINLPETSPKRKRVGIEKRAGERWPGKAWNGYDALACILETTGYEVLFFSERNTLMDYLQDIGNCNYIISGDTLAMHVGLACGLPTLAIFTCTAPWEIYDYGILHKVVSTALDQAFYQTEPVTAAIEAVSVEQVLQAFLKMVDVSAA
jgi:heptosyltransferase II